MPEDPFTSDPIPTPLAGSPAGPAGIPSLPGEPKPTDRFWTGWDAWVMLAMAIAGSIFASLFCQVGYLLLEGAFKWPSLRSGDLGSNPYFILAVQLVLYVLLVTFLYFLITHKYRLGFRHSLRLLKLPVASMRSFALVGIVLALTVMVLSSLFPSARETPLEKIFGQGHAIYFFALFGIFIAPFTEELIFRGFLFPVFENLGGRFVAVLSTAVIFAGLHVPQLWGSWPAIMLILLVGLVLSFTRAVTGLLTPSWIIHLAYNATLVMAVVAAKALMPFAHPLR